MRPPPWRRLRIASATPPYCGSKMPCFNRRSTSRGNCSSTGASSCGSGMSLFSAPGPSLFFASACRATSGLVASLSSFINGSSRYFLIHQWFYQMQFVSAQQIQTPPLGRSFPCHITTVRLLNLRCQSALETAQRLILLSNLFSQLKTFLALSQSSIPVIFLGSKKDGPK